MTPSMISRRHANYTLALLFVIYTVNFIDRQILSILMESIRLDLHINDTQLGLLTGMAFALFYATFGLPIAWAADRFSRKKIIAGALVLWSGMTAVCGLAQSFTHLMLARIGVAVGEAGSGPPSHSMLADLFPHGKRATALSIFALGVPVGFLIGLAGGGYLNELFNWRVAFFVVGLPGVALAVVLLLTVKEPPREADPIETGRKPSILTTIATLVRIRSLRNLVIASTLHSLAGYGLLQWNPSFMMRNFELGSAEVGLKLGLVVGIASGLGTFLGGYYADKFGKSDVRWYSWFPAIQNVVTVPFYVCVYFAPTFELALVFILIPALMSNAFAGPVFGLVQTLAPVSMRATAAALLMFFFALVGQGGGPFLIGMFSDMFRAMGEDSALRYAMVAILPAFLVSAVLYWVAGIQLAEDLSQPKTDADAAALASDMNS